MEPILTPVDKHPDEWKFPNGVLLAKHDYSKPKTTFGQEVHGGSWGRLHYVQVSGEHGLKVDDTGTVSGVEEHSHPHTYGVNATEDLPWKLENVVRNVGNTIESWTEVEESGSAEKNKITLTRYLKV
jgi:hypothetical protein